MIHIYHGTGKGKTTASVGLAVRASGAGRKVYFFQFLKSGTSSEISVLKKTGIKVSCCEKCTRFTFLMTDTEKQEVAERHNDMLDEALKITENNSEEILIVLDELLDAYNMNMLDRTKAEKLIQESDEKTELVLTGRNPAEFFIASADYISNIEAEKHPYSSGTPARKGIEY